MSVFMKAVFISGAIALLANIPAFAASTGETDAKGGCEKSAQPTGSSLNPPKADLVVQGTTVKSPATVQTGGNPEGQDAPKPSAE